MLCSTSTAQPFGTGLSVLFCIIFVQERCQLKIEFSHFDIIYAEIASTHDIAEAGAYLYGWTGQLDAFNQTWRLVLERQESTAAKENENAQGWTTGIYPSSHDGISRNTYLLDKSTSASLYLQMENDHKLSVVLQDSYQDQNRYKNTNFTYQFPAIAGMVHAGIGYSQQDGDKTENSTSFWTGYEFRF
mgnify:CR=1 FL=1